MLGNWRPLYVNSCAAIAAGFYNWRRWTRFYNEKQRRSCKVVIKTLSEELYTDTSSSGTRYVPSSEDQISYNYNSTNCTEFSRCTASECMYFRDTVSGHITISREEGKSALVGFHAAGFSILIDLEFRDAGSCGEEKWRTQQKTLEARRDQQHTTLIYQTRWEATLTTASSPIPTQRPWPVLERNYKADAPPFRKRSILLHSRRTPKSLIGFYLLSSSVLAVIGSLSTPTPRRFIPAILNR